MLKIVTLALILSTISFVTVWAQLGIGVEAGMNNTTFEGVQNFNNSPETQYQFGAYVDIPVLPLFGVTAGLNYAKRSSSSEYIGTVYDPSIGLTPMDYSYSLDYLEIPVLLKVGTPVAGNKILVSFLVGPQLNFLISGTEEIKYLNNTISENAAENFDNPVLSIATGLRIEIAVAQGAFTFGFFYNYDLGTTKEQTLQLNSFSVKMRKYSVTVGYYLPLKAY